MKAQLVWVRALLMSLLQKQLTLSAMKAQLVWVRALLISLLQKQLTLSVMKPT